jgi:hypothetical protein
VISKKQQSLSSPFDNIFEQMKRTLDGPPKDFLEELQALPSCESLPTPWESCLLFALIEYRQRQDWGRRLLLKHMPQAVPSSASSAL